MMTDHDLRQEMLTSIPNLRAFAVSLTGNLTYADDLVQTTLLKGIENLDKFEPGTHMRAWLFTILRNQFFSDVRRKRREVDDPDGAISGRFAVMPTQDARLHFTDMQAALSKLSPDQREVLLLVGAEGLSYEEAAQVVGTNIGTVKSRINRARNRLMEILGLEQDDDFGPDRLEKASMPAHSLV